MMKLYRLFDFILASEIEFPELLGISSVPGDECNLQPENNNRYSCLLRYATLPLARSSNSEAGPYHQWILPDGKSWLLIIKQEDEYLLQFPNLATFQVSNNGKVISCAPGAGSPLVTIRHLFLDQVMPLVLSLSGRQAIHASAVATPSGILAFCGKSGQGKSTLAASFARLGYPVIGDDCLLLEANDGELRGIAGYPGMRLWDDSQSVLLGNTEAATEVAHYTAKKRVTLGADTPHFTGQPLPIRHIFFLQNDGAEPADTRGASAISITPLAPADVFIELVSYIFKLAVRDRDLLRSEFLMLSLVSRLPLFSRLSYPHDYTLLPSVQAKILASLEP